MQLVPHLTSCVWSTHYILPDCLLVSHQCSSSLHLIDYSTGPYWHKSCQQDRLQILSLSQYISKSNIANKFLISIYSVWNLDGLQVYMPPMCLGKRFGNLQVLAFQYLIALYPLILVLVTYALAELHARQWWCVYWLLWPVVKLFKVLRISIDPMRSIMNTFATFVLLSVTKFTIVSVNILTYVKLYVMSMELW